MKVFTVICRLFVRIVKGPPPEVIAKREIIRLERSSERNEELIRSATAEEARLKELEERFIAHGTNAPQRERRRYAYEVLMVRDKLRSADFRIKLLRRRHLIVEECKRAYETVLVLEGLPTKEEVEELLSKAMVQRQKLDELADLKMPEYEVNEDVEIAEILQDMLPEEERARLAAERERAEHERQAERERRADAELAAAAPEPVQAEPVQERREAELEG